MTSAAPQPPELSTPTTPAQLTKAQRKALRQLEENEQNRKRIKIANIEHINKQSCCSADAMFSPPEKKGQSIIVEEDNMKPAFTVGEYVKVAGDTSPGKNRPEGFGFIVGDEGYGAATLSDVNSTITHIIMGTNTQKSR